MREGTFGTLAIILPPILPLKNGPKVKLKKALKKDKLIPVQGHTGLYYRESPSRSFTPEGSTKSRPERAYVIQFYSNGKTTKETQGWESDTGFDFNQVIVRLGELRAGAETKIQKQKAIKVSRTLNEYWDQVFKPWVRAGYQAAVFPEAQARTLGEVLPQGSCR